VLLLQYYSKSMSTNERPKVASIPEKFKFRRLLHMTSVTFFLHSVRVLFTSSDQIQKGRP